MTHARATRSAIRKRSSDARLDLLFKALGDGTRRTLLARLAEKPQMISELAEPFAMSLPAVSRHIRVLEHAGLVIRSVDGRVHECALDAKPLGEVDEWLDRYRGFWTGQLESLARYVAVDSVKRTKKSRETAYE